MTITDTTFFSSISNFTIFVDSITLDEQVTTNFTITFTNLTSVGSNFTNTNATFDARADFIGLDIGLTIRNINTSTDLFTSATGSQNFNATFTPGQLLRIMSMTTTTTDFVCTPGDRAINNLTIIFFALAIMAIPLFVLFRRGDLVFDEIDIKTILIIFIAIIVGLAFIRIIASNVASVCI